MRRIWKKLSSFFWWNYARGTVEYDIMVALILAFIFFTPRTFFRDQPRPFTARTPTVTMVTTPDGHLFEILGAGPHPDIKLLIQKYAGRRVDIRTVKTLHDQESSAIIYNVWTD